MKTYLLSLVLFFMGQLQAQNVGIGISAPIAGLQVNSNNGFMVKGVLGSGSSLTETGAGEKLIWYPKKGALRVGGVTPFLNSYWDDVNIGNYSMALGYDVLAKGTGSVALGGLSRAFGDYSLATGNSTTASGNSSTAMGINSVASGSASVAIGNNAQASATNSIAIGTDVSTNGKVGSMILGDGGDGDGTHVFTTEADNQLFTRFKGGYKFYTSGWGTTLGAVLLPGANSWSSFSDERLKENFEALNSEEVLKKLSAVNYTSWNYKIQDSKTFRHYGIMAQDFFKAFGHDNYGTIGNETMVNPIDMMGIAYSAIQALEKRTQKIEDLQEENSNLKKQINALALTLANIQQQLTSIFSKQINSQ